MIYSKAREVIIRLEISREQARYIQILAEWSGVLPLAKKCGDSPRELIDTASFVCDHECWTRV